MSGLVLGPWLYAETPVEISLVEKLDEPRGFCVDTLGFQTEARPEEGLQSHSCYSYRGQLAVDQAFDADRIPNGTFQIIEFDLCMTARDLSTGSKLGLEACDGRDTQQFDHQANGKIRLLTVPEICVTVGEAPSRHGGGGDPVHLIRDLTLEVCDIRSDDRQKWRLRESAD